MGSDADVVVVGAGAAGLAAALELAQRSLRVIVLEARDRVGGRVRWERAGSVWTPVELGAEFIHGDAVETSAYLREAGLRAIPNRGTSWDCDAGGVLHQSTDDFVADGVFEAARSLPDDVSVATLLRRVASDPRKVDAARRARLFVEGFEAADPEIASARAIAEELGSGVDATSARPVGSYAPLFEYLVARCEDAGVDLRLNAPASRVGWSAGNVRVQYDAASTPAATISARCAVVTVPVGVLQRSGGGGPVFEPPLPARKHQALAALAMGHVVRVVLAFRSPFWEELAGGRYRDASFFRCEPGAYHAFWTQMPQRTRTIVAWAGGPRATPLAALDTAARIEKALEEFGSLLGASHAARAEFESGATHDWSADAYACGAYSYVRVAGGAARAALAEPLNGTLFFAGEATALDGQGGTVSGGFASGIRAAREAAAALGAGAAPAERPP